MKSGKFYRKEYPRYDRGTTKLGERVFYRICEECESEWLPKNGGQGKRNADRCDTCYKLYRRAQNLVGAAKFRSNKQKLDFNLSVDFVHNKLKQKCPRTGLSFIFEGGLNYSNRHPLSPSIDKIDPSKGYTEDNIQVVCWWYNVSKQQFTDTEVLELCKAVVNSSSMAPAKSVGQKML